MLLYSSPAEALARFEATAADDAWFADQVFRAAVKRGDETPAADDDAA